MCLNPIKMINPAYKISKKNPLNNRTPLDERLRYITVPCGHCAECRRSKKMSWQIRLQEHNKYMIKQGYKGYFVTLTFDDISLIKLTYKSHTDDALIICSLAIKLFRDRFRKSSYSDISDLHYFLIPELGHQHENRVTTERLHLHGIIWLNKKLPEIYTDQYVKPRTKGSTLSNVWLYGNIYFGHDVSNRAINYITKYILKVDKDHPDFHPNPYHSRFLGDNFLKEHSNYKFNGEKTVTQYRLDNGKMTALPSYYMHKLYSSIEREKLQIQLLDREYQYVHGIKVHKSQLTDELVNTLTLEAKKKFKDVNYSHDYTKYPVSLTIKQLIDNNEQYTAYNRLLQPLYSKRSILNKTLLDNAFFVEYPDLCKLYKKEIEDITNLITYIKSVKNNLKSNINKIYLKIIMLQNKYKDNFKIYYYGIGTKRN